ncbi:glycosyltransferase family protein [Haploplasma axanthum]|uniref:Uncharacterized protein n=1 Tax=Haploplasma axanthum TaxID=29552 RepID=A0A449BC26_HAPAX|nr:hypothetical protein [Haploplasma axanthum]VEU79988.1 Uncharacterised protein [Haploplasma axanthum]
MSKILIITSTINPIPDANGLIALNLKEELTKFDNQVVLVGVSDSNRFGLGDHLISQSKYASKEKSAVKRVIKKIGRLISNGVNYKKFPSFDLEQNKKVYMKIDELNKENKFDIIISLYKPYSNIAALIDFKEKHQDIIACAYFLDFIHDTRKPFFLGKKAWNKLIHGANSKVINKLDITYYGYNSMEYLKKNMSENEYKKICFLEIPSYRKNVNEITEVKSINLEKSIRIIFAGTLNKKIRNPIKAFKILKDFSIKTKTQINVELYGNTMRVDYKKYNNDFFSIKSLPSINSDEVYKKYLEADILLNIGNNGVTNAIPSKIFELFSTYKPIINFVNNKEDNSLKYFNKYPSVLNIDVNQKVELKRINDFIKCFSNEQSIKKEVDQEFYKNSIENVAKIINERIKGIN